MSAVGIVASPRCRRKHARLCLGIVVAYISLSVGAQVTPPSHEANWQDRVRDQVKQGNVDAALQAINKQLVMKPDDLEARGWLARIIGWKGEWAQAEHEYRKVLRVSPNDVDILCGLADVLLWQGKLQPALETIDRARDLSPYNLEVLLRRAKLLRALGRTKEARAEFDHVLLLDSQNSEARGGLASVRGEHRHELRFGNDVDTFNYIDTAETQSVVLSSRWNRHWSTNFTSSFYQRFGKQAQRLASDASFRFSKADWVGVGGAAANDNGIIPKREASAEYGHSFQFPGRWVRGIDASYQQRWLWYQGAHILILSLSQTYYFPRGWTWTLVATGARSGFTSSGIDWAPSGSTKLGLPIVNRISGELLFAVGSEDFAEIDQIGRFSARTFGGGLHLRITSTQDVSGYVAHQVRSQAQTQTTYGLSYGIRF